MKKKKITVVIIKQKKELDALENRQSVARKLVQEQMNQEQTY